ncbi:PH domain-containing protein [Caerostris darwini]|uniref:PH domain-containing protein n=1 Tax=Caerostris darwini TaxID=1538125 RepID=A0AAV4TY75_9ARAC|nr:PH domain-containing protein [Caerostris darwini]
MGSCRPYFDKKPQGRHSPHCAEWETFRPKHAIYPFRVSNRAASVTKPNELSTGLKYFMHRVVGRTVVLMVDVTSSDSSTGKGDLLIFCKEAVGLLQAIATTIHQILSHHSSQEGGGYQKELEEIGAWLVPDTPSSPAEDYYKVPPRQVKSLLDIPNFIFDKPLTPVATFAGSTGAAMDASKPPLDVPKTILTSASEECSELISGDILNCSVTSFVVGGGNFPGKSSDSELSDAYTPPRSPEVKAKREPEAATEA